ncbi:MAG: trigger factor [Erysipelotrichales bacterium]|nr:trigger factor [Erysipelotrichales bacterium]
MQIENLKNNKIKVTFKVTKDEFEEGLNVAFEENKKKVEIKGFRKGHVTREIFEKKFGVKALFQDAIYYWVEKKYQDFLETKTHVPVSKPDLEIDDEKIERGTDFEFSINVTVRPEAKLGEYKGLKVKKADTGVTDFEIEDSIANLQKRDGKLVAKKGALELKDVAVFDYEGFLNGIPFEGGKAENAELEIGSGRFIPGFEEQMAGMKPGEEKELSVTFPEQYHSEELKGQSVVFKVKLHEIKTKVLAELTEEYIAGLKIENVKTKEELEAHFRNKLEENKKNAEENRIFEDLLALLFKNTKLDIPAEMLDREEDYLKGNVTQQAKQYGLDLQTFLQYTGQTIEKFELEVRSEADKRVRTELILSAIAKNEKFEISEEAVNAHYDNLANVYGKSTSEIRKLIAREDVLTDLGIQEAKKLLTDSAVYE